MQSILNWNENETTKHFFYLDHEVYSIKRHPEAFYNKKDNTKWYNKIHRTKSASRCNSANRSQTSFESNKFFTKDTSSKGVCIFFQRNFVLYLFSLIFVQIFGIDINGNGYSWLQSVTLNHKVQFLPISKSNPNFAECQVTLLQNPALNAKVVFLDTFN